MTPKQEDFVKSFSSQAQVVFSEMVPAYQEGYMAYVYQTSNPQTQKRRLRQLNKIFCRLAEEPSFYLQPLDKEQGQEIVTNWASLSEDSLLAASLKESLWGKEPPQAQGEILRNGALVAFYQLSLFSRIGHLVLIFKPGLVDKHVMTTIYQLVENEVVQKGHIDGLRLKATNTATEALYEQWGFQFKEDLSAEGARLFQKSL
ncbi:hypothetical protein [Streptococcus cuniculipharyngis]|uniref:N-acetyltransferase domain-containing protein n=1 Tax=Streptococcus cuniculipharyngis TaxID=1562651 RepID=A0A5C5SG16_9STRE|nr:hypothetical protein [Streptococcus cuniculipharyngis]TWS98945.1 hypothetical protein FRX57_01725 [Streptococcus cuniculipharyngis]